MTSKMKGYSMERDGWEAVVSFLKNSSTPMLVVSHIFPDGDAIGSLIAFSGISEHLGLKCQLVLDDACPIKYRFLEGWEKIRNLQLDPPREKFSRVVVLDAGAFHR
ncbi:MAG: DHH family phosphoesterase, partial [bacterium]